MIKCFQWRKYARTKVRLLAGLPPGSPVEQILFIPLLAGGMWHHPGWPRHRHRLGLGAQRPPGAGGRQQRRSPPRRRLGGIREMLRHARPTPVDKKTDRHWQRVRGSFLLETTIAPRISRRTGCSFQHGLLEFGYPTVPASQGPNPSPSANIGSEQHALPAGCGL